MSAALGALVPRHRLAGALGGAAAGAAIELPGAGLALAIAGLATRDPAGLAVGAALGAATTRVWPTAPRTVEQLRRHNTKDYVAPSPDGAGVVIVVNPGAGSAEEHDTAAHLRERLPAAEVVECGEDDDVSEVMATAVARATTAFGAVGGDGTLNAAATLAHERSLPLLALPGGTLNHFARDMGVLSIDDAIDALQVGEVIRVDLADAGGHAFVNTASFGAYTDLVDAREQLEDRVGKWPAVAVALVGVLRRATPVDVVVDGQPRRLWLGFIGNGRYQPPGFAPTWRETLDEGVLDMRVVDAEQPFARVRLLLAVLTGRLGGSAVYQERLRDELELACDDGELRVALDGEVIDLTAPVKITIREPALRAFAPHR